MVRNAGGRVFDAIRTLAVLQTIGAPGTIIVMHHTGMLTVGLNGFWLSKIQWRKSADRSPDCGMTHFHDATIKKALTEIAPEASQSIEASSFGEIAGSIEESIQHDLALLKASPLIKNTTLLLGMKYDIETGVLTVVETSGAEGNQAASL
ncbi:hypothetical protein LTS10_005685 [Elasticomyces elasticus]|nr:hypothetical protein LTS10_005685 [Elasticomyces elasticus]